tara:strand:+ start:23794 stop:24207 length:414 start_codon:yes stop_codon:yes gene_type:complete
VRILKHIVGLFAISLALTNCQGGGGEPTPENCGYYKTGTFKYVGSDDIRIERTDSLQIEYNLNGEGGYIYTDKFNVVWTSDCEYYLTLNSTDHPEDLDFLPSDTMWTKITKVGRAGYTFTAVKGSHIFEGELKKTDS